METGVSKEVWRGIRDLGKIPKTSRFFWGFPSSSANLVKISNIDFRIWSFANLWDCRLGKAFDREAFWSECVPGQSDMSPQCGDLTCQSLWMIFLTNMCQPERISCKIVSISIIFWLLGTGSRKLCPSSFGRGRSAQLYWTQTASQCCQLCNCAVLLLKAGIFGRWWEQILCPLTPISSSKACAPPPLPRQEGEIIER